MSKVFLVRLHVIQFTRYSVKFLQALARSELLYVSTTLFVCQVLFSSFSNFFSCVSLSSGPAAVHQQLPYDNTMLLICQRVFSTLSNSYISIFYLFSKKLKGPLSRPLLYLVSGVIQHHRSGHNHRRFCDKQQRRIRRYLRHGTRRNHDPADSSAGQPLLWSSA